MPFRLLGEMVNSPLVLDSSVRYLDSSVRYLDRPCKRGILSQQKEEEATPTLLPTRFVDAKAINTETINNVCLRNEMEIQSKMLDALLEKAEQVTRLWEVSDDTKCETSHKSDVVDQLRADNDGKGNLSQEELRAYLRYAVAKDFHRVGFNYDEAVINKFVEDLILVDQESKRMEEETPKIVEENYVMPKGNFMSYKFTGVMIRPRCLLILKIVLQIR
jgi:hypothetical protein